jgi:hypothetical protein
LVFHNLLNLRLLFDNTRKHFLAPYDKETTFG